MKQKSRAEKMDFVKKLLKGEMQLQQPTVPNIDLSKLTDDELRSLIKIQEKVKIQEQE